MKKTSSFAIAAILSLALTTTSFAASPSIEANKRGNNTVDLEFNNLIEHGDMEQVSSGTYPNLPAGWEWPYDNTVGAATVNVGQNTSISNTGSKSLRADISALPDNSGLMFAQGVGAIIPGETYKAQAAFNVTSVNNAKIVFYLRWLDSSSSEIKIDSATPVDSVTGGFIKKSIEAVAPVGAQSVEVRFSFIGTAAGGSIVAYTDSVTLAESSKIGITELSRNGKTIYSGTSNFFSDASITESGILEYKAKFHNAVGDVLSEQTTSIDIGSFSGENGDMSTTVIGGPLSISTTPTNFSAVVLDTEANSLSSTANGTVKVKDDTGEGKGWSMKIKGTDFISDNIPDPTSGGKGTFRLAIGASALSIVPGTITTNAGQAVDATGGPLAFPIGLTGNLQTLVQSQAGFGMGSYSIPLAFGLAIPKTVDIISQGGSGSKYHIGSSVGTIATIYRSTLTYVTGTGL